MVGMIWRPQQIIPGGDLVEGNKIGQNHLAGGGKMVLCHNLFTQFAPTGRKMSRYVPIFVL